MLVSLAKPFTHSLCWEGCVDNGKLVLKSIVQWIIFMEFWSNPDHVSMEYWSYCENSVWATYILRIRIDWILKKRNGQLINQKNATSILLEKKETLVIQVMFT